MKNNKLLAVAGAIATTVFLLPFVFRVFSWTGPYVTGAIVYSISLLFGAVNGRVFGPSTSVVAGLAAFLTASILCIPIILVTYGFALLGSPLVIIYGLLYGIASKKIGVKYVASQ